jgi:hypothetical protein
MREEMYPVERHISCILKDIVVRMSHQSDVLMTLFTFGYEVHNDLFGMLAVACECGGYLDNVKIGEL